MNKIAFIFSGYSRNLIFSNDSVTNYDVYKGNVLNTLKHIGSNVECINLMLKNLERVKNIIGYRYWLSYYFFVIIVK